MVAAPRLVTPGGRGACGRAMPARYARRMNAPPLEILEQTTGADTSVSPVASVIVLHGLGADGRDFVPIVGELDLDALGPVRFVFPSAPVRPVTINGGYPMRAWYDIYPPATRAGELRREDTAGLMASRDQVQALIDREVARGVPPGRIVLMGFSQGSAMTLLAGLQAPRRLAGLAALSGYLPLAASTARTRGEANRDVPIFLAHGSQDEVVVPERGLATHEALLALGYPVDWHTYAMGHTVCAEEVADLNAWLLRVLG
jgi:phospholipase/carboxylesterase